jgi:uncharacterized membrane protein
VFVPSIPTPLVGAVYILDRDRVHLLDVPFTDAVKSISRWGSGSKDMVAAMRRANERLQDADRSGRNGDSASAAVDIAARAAGRSANL